MTRTLRSKSQRALLWYAANGFCQQCGAPLGDDWEADHIVPWVVTKRTNVHEMQALCKRCNRRKGARMLRAHQRDVADLCQVILGGETIDRVFISVTPGGGKSLIPVILAHHLIPRIADAVCWVVPRRSLALQGEGDFADKSRSLIPHTHQIRVNTNDVNPCRGHQGYTTTYQALLEDKGHTNLQAFRGRRFILILDEPHHIQEDSPFQRAVQPLVDNAVLTVFMSGTWERGNKYQRVAFAPYVVTDGGYMLQFPDHTDTVPELNMAFVRYTRAKALQERAIKQLRLITEDARAEWVDRTGATQQVQSLAESGDYASEALFTALNTGYALQLLERCTRDWQAHRAAHPHDKFLVVAHNIVSAKLYLKKLRDMGIARSDIATSEETAAATAAIEQFKRLHTDASALDGLVTVAMAYEGMDVPGITHVACLTHIRSKPWIEQMAARAARVDPRAGPWEEQIGYIYGPDDPLLHACFASIIEEQEPFVRASTQPQPIEGADVPPAKTSGGDILPLAGTLTRERVIDLTNGQGIDYAQTAIIREALTLHNVAGVIDPLLFMRISATVDSLVATAHPEARPLTAVLPASQVERQMRAAINDHAKRHDRQQGWDFGATNKLIMRQFRKPRDEMAASELQQVWAWLQETYPTNGR
jgi:superfamily II DNA or RNA helicase